MRTIKIYRVGLGWKWSILADRICILISYAVVAANGDSSVLCYPTAAPSGKLLAWVETRCLNRGYDSVAKQKRLNKRL